jgi:hypothetical protein
MALGRMDQAWIHAEAALPLGWHLDSLRCASTGLTPEQRSETWVAVAAGPGGEELNAEGQEPVAALNALTRLLQQLRDPMSG